MDEPLTPNTDGKNPGARSRSGTGPDLNGLETWVFDLDNTLYPPSSNLFDQIDRRIGAFVEQFLSLGPGEALSLQKQYFRTYGTTLHGLIENHGVDAREFLDFVHDIDFSLIPPDPELADALRRLPGRKILFTNADLPYSNQVMERIGIVGLFDGIFDIEAAGFLPKPHPITYHRLLEAHEINPTSAALVDDLPKNLVPAAALGMTTVWIRNDHWTEAGPLTEPLEFDHVVDDLAPWLNRVAPAAGAG